MVVPQSIRSTLRNWSRNPGFALAAIGVLALAFGASTAMFSVLDRILFRDPPYPNADRLVSVGLILPGPGGILTAETMPDKGYIQLWSPPPGPFESVTTTLGSGPCDLTQLEPERLSCMRVESTFLSVLQTHVARGRDFQPEDDMRGAPKVALISHALWTRRFGNSPDVLDRMIQLDGEPVSIVGILPEAFEPPLGTADILLPEQIRPIDPRADFVRLLAAFGRLKPGRTPEQAQAALEPLSRGIVELMPRQPQTAPKWRVRSLRDRQVGDARRAAWLLFGGVAALLMIACVTVTSLMLARIAARRREFAIRIALGARKLGLARLAFTESLLLAVVAGSLGLLLAFGLLKAFVALAPAGIPQLDHATLDVRVIVVSIGLTLVAAGGIGLWPAFSAFRIAGLSGYRVVETTKPRARLTLVSCQIAVAVLMLGCSALLTRSLWNQVAVPLGFEPGRVTTLAATLNLTQYSTPELRASFFGTLLERARNSPGVEVAALTDAPPPRGLTRATSNIAVDGQPWDPEAVGPPVRMRNVTPGYFEAFRIPIKDGRPFLETDAQEIEPAVVLSESLRRLLFGSQTGVGRRIRLQKDGPWHRVVGVVSDTQNTNIGEPPQPEIYVLSTTAFSQRSAYLIVRSVSATRETEALLRTAIAALAPQLPVRIESVETQVAAITARPRFVAWLLASFTTIGLLLASAGIYGVASFVVTQRTKEIGVRLALGATPARVSRDLVSEAGLWIAAGVVAGVFLAWTSRSLFESQLFGISTNDGVSWGTALAILVAAMLAALARPILRAARTDPAQALRAE